MIHWWKLQFLRSCQSSVFTGVANLYIEMVTVLLFCWLVDIGQRGMLGKRSVLFDSELYWLACCVIEGYVNTQGKNCTG